MAAMVRTRVQRWWPVAAFVATALVLQAVLLTNRYDVSGHAAEHLTNAGAPFFASAVLLVLLWATPQGRRQPDVLLACAAWLAATVVILAGNVRVIDDLVDAGLGHAPTDGLADVADHGLANSGMWSAAAAAVVMAIVFGLRRHVSPRVAIGAGALSVLFPPWIVPGAGVVVLVVARCIAFARSPSS